MMTKSNRNTSLDAFKCVAALAVVFLHYNQVEGVLGEYYSEIVRSLTRFAVPFFFMVTGYYWPFLVERGKLKANLIKCMKLAIGSTVFYLTYRIIMVLIAGESVGRWLMEHYTPGTLFSWIVFNDDPAGYHQWYLYALVYSLAFYSILHKDGKDNWVKFITPVLLMFIVLCNYTQLTFVRNYILGIPCIGLGIMTRQYRWYERIKPMPIIILSAVFSIIEMLLTRESYSQGFDVYCGSIPLALATLCLAISNPTKFEGSYIATIGLKYSGLIYILHVFCSNILSLWIDWDSTTLQVLRPFIIFIVTLVVTIIYNRVKQCIHET